MEIDEQRQQSQISQRQQQECMQLQYQTQTPQNVDTSIQNSHHIDQQQYYQNHDEVASVEVDDGLSLEVLLIMHRQSEEDYAKKAKDIKLMLHGLHQQLDIIRNETPAYSVDEADI